MTYTIQIDKPALKFLQKQPQAQRERLLRAIRDLPDNGDRKRLQGHSDLFRLRVGTYRIIYTVDNGKFVVCVIDAGNRGQIYNRY